MPLVPLLVFYSVMPKCDSPFALIQTIQIRFYPHQADLIGAALGKLITVVIIELLIAPLVKRIAYFLHKLIVEIEVMQNRKSHSKRFLCFKEMPDIRP